MPTFCSSFLKILPAGIFCTVLKGMPTLLLHLFRRFFIISQLFRLREVKIYCLLEHYGVLLLHTHTLQIPAGGLSSFFWSALLTPLLVALLVSSDVSLSFSPSLAGSLWSSQEVHWGRTSFFFPFLFLIKVLLSL